jgi:hypothetical protein
MPTGNDCPACGENIGLAAVFKAPVPNRIYCPHCGERLRYGETWGPIIAAVFALNAFILAAVAGAAVVGFDEPILAIAVTLGLLVFGGVAVEVACVMVLWYGAYRLELVNRPRDDWDEF